MLAAGRAPRAGSEQGQAARTVERRRMKEPLMHLERDAGRGTEHGAPPHGAAAGAAQRQAAHEEHAKKQHAKQHVKSTSASERHALSPVHLGRSSGLGVL
eukprot:350715-Chlamydomonas_euryale.AAC.2